MFLSLKMEDLGKISQLTSKGSIDYNIVRKVNLILSKNADVPHKKWGIKDCETTMFKRLLAYNDIVAVVLIHDDGRKERYYVEYQESTSAGCNELQSTELDNEGNLVIKIGDFNE